MQTGLPVQGYTGQSDANVDLVNFNKRLEEMVLRTIDAHTHHPDTDMRWVAIARNHVEQGFMALNRSVFKPERIAGNLDVEGFSNQLDEMGTK